MSIAIERVRVRGDGWLSATTATLIVAGLVMVLSASQAVSYVYYHSSYYLFARQAVFAILGAVALVVFSRVDYHVLRRRAPLAAVVSIALMCMVLLPGIGVASNGARRWLNLGPLGTLQPSDIAKLGLAVFLSNWITRRGPRVRSFGDTLVPFLIMLAVTVGLLMLEKDLGTTLVMTSIFCAVYFTGGAPKRYVALLAVILVLAFVGLISIERYRIDRVAVFLDPFQDPQGKTYQAYQALLGLGSGGLAGVGLMHSVLKYQWLPQADTDFIFAIVGEETGLIGATLLLFGFVLFAVRGYRAAMRAPDRFGLTLAAAITTWISLQALVNMAVVTNTLPITGVPLPFISRGGTALAVTMAAAGVLLNISSQGVRQSYLGNRSTDLGNRRSDATADSGRRYGRPSVAGTRGRAGAPR